MATDECRRESREWCEIHVSVDAPPPHDLGVYRRLRFGLLASSWLPIRVGRFFWIALHVPLIVGWPPFAMVIWLAVLPIGTGFLLFYFLYIVLLHGLGAVLTLAVDSVVLLVRSIRFCWSVVCNHVIFLASQESTLGVWRLEDFGTVRMLKSFKKDLFDILWCLAFFVVPCVRGGWFKTWMDVMMEVWVPWCTEVEYMPDAIAI